jgi:hypothetical protein
MAVAVHEARKHGAAAEIERRLARSRIDVAALPGDATRPSRITKESTMEPTASIV